MVVLELKRKAWASAISLKLLWECESPGSFGVFDYITATLLHARAAWMLSK